MAVAVDKKPRHRRSYRRLPILLPRCDFNRKYPCKRQHPKTWLCPIQDPGFLGLLDFYFMGGMHDEAGGIRDMHAVPQLMCKEIACLFDDDFRALDLYCAWKASRKLEDESSIEFMRRTFHVTPRLCRQFRRAWCRYFVRFKPLEIRAPSWLESYGDWKGMSVGYQQQRGIVKDERQARKRPGTAEAANRKRDH